MTVPRELIEQTRALFRTLSSARPRLFFAPGRANLLGAHVDYNGGLVMPVALSRGTCAAFLPRPDGRLRLRSSNFPDQPVELAVAELRPGRTRGWSAYLEGALWTAQRAWGPLPGLDVAVCADLPMSKGLSSSASIEAVAVYAAAHLLGVEAQPDELIRLAHAAENEYVGVRCGILDQAAIILARENSLLYLDCLQMTREHLPLDGAAVTIGIVDSGVPRNLATSAFNQRVAECTRALGLLQEQLPGITCLRDLRRGDFEAQRDRLPPVLQRRALHVIGETERTERGAEALRRGDLASFGRLVNDTHLSLRDLYEVSTPELDALAFAAQGVPGCFGARLTGAGFGGCVVALVEPAACAGFARQVPAAYRQATGRDTEVMWFTPAGGPSEL